MSVIQKMLIQTAVYWGSPEEDGDGGYTFPAPVEIAVRWEEVDGIIRDPRTNATVDRSKVYVDRDVDLGGYLYLGSLSDVDGADPVLLEGAQKITGFEKTPNFKGTEFLRMAEL